MLSGSAAQMNQRLSRLMGYEIHITRRSHWSDEIGKAIAADEWSRVANGDSSLHRAPDSNEGFYEFPEGDGWFDFAEGCISTKNPNEATLIKAH